MRAASVRLVAIDEEQIRRERSESARLLQDAERARIRAEQIALKVRRMNALYRERLVGVREDAR